MFKVLTKGCEPTRGSKYSACIDLYASEDVTIGAGETKLVGLGVAIDCDMTRKQYFRSLPPEINCFPTAEQNELYEEFKRSNYLQLMLRSSLAKKGLIIANGVGVIDLDYKDEIKIAIHNPTKIKYEFANDTGGAVECDDVYSIKKGDKIGQIMLMEHKSYMFGIESKHIRNGGFGSTGTR